MTKTQKPKAENAETTQNKNRTSVFGADGARNKLSVGYIVEIAKAAGFEDPLFKCHDKLAKAQTSINGQEFLNFSTYDYLDINAHPEITAAVTQAAEMYGTSAGASRLVGGERPPHTELERALADLYEVDDCILYVSGHATNVSTLGYLCGTGDLILYDSLAHNSLMQGAKLAGCKRLAYNHNDTDSLEKALKKYRDQFKRVLIVTEGLFSMDGNIPDLPRIIELKKEYGCALLVDEAHSLGTLGATGRGAREHFNLDPNDVDMWMSTLSKSLCGCGGFIAGNSQLIRSLKYGSPGFVFSVGMPPIIAVACKKALDIMLREPERVHKLQHISKYFLEYAKSLGLDTGEAQGYANVPIILGQSLFAAAMAHALFKRGVYTMPISFPAVKEGTSRLRFFLSAAHSEEDIRRALDITLEEIPAAKIMAAEAEEKLQAFKDAEAKKLKS